MGGVLKLACVPTKFEAVGVAIAFQPRRDVGDAPEPDDVAARKDAGASGIKRDGCDPQRRATLPVACVPKPGGEERPAFATENERPSGEKVTASRKAAGVTEASFNSPVTGSNNRMKPPAHATNRSPLAGENATSTTKPALRSKLRQGHPGRTCAMVPSRRPAHQGWWKPGCIETMERK